MSGTRMIERIDELLPALSALTFAAKKHQRQFRRDGVTPYAAHPSRVTLILRHLFEVDDPHTLTLAALHDTIEDTKTDFEDLECDFGKLVAEHVALLSDDKRLPEEERERRYLEAIAGAPASVQLVKLADSLDNRIDEEQGTPQQRALGLKFTLGTLEALREATDPRVVHARALVEEYCRQHI